MRDLPDKHQQNDLRPAAHVMRLSQMGAMFPTRLSFLRVILRHLANERAEVTRRVWEMDTDGVGHAVYSLRLGGHDYSLVAVSRDLPPEQRTDRVIATAWDAAFVLYDGIPLPGEIDRIREQAPLQEAGRFSERDLVLSRANKSVRLWSEIVAALRAGAQPPLRRINDIGYLMRTTAVYGNGKFGIADRTRIAERPGLKGPFAAEMLTVWLIRHFTHDLIEHVGGAPLDREIKRHLGIGNATGLGMAPFLVSHPVLLNNWMMGREIAIARVRGVERLTEAQITSIRDLADRAAAHISQWHPAEAGPAMVRDRLEAGFSDFLTQDVWTPASLSKPLALDQLARAAAEVSAEVEELTLALMLEPFGGLVDDLTEGMDDPDGPQCLPVQSTAALKTMLETHCSWALGINYDAPEHCARFWYVSEEKLEPRLGQRFNEPGAELESPLDIARRIAALHADLPEDDVGLSEFLTKHPGHLLAVERVQIAVGYPYANIQDNLIAATCRPIDMLRAKLAMFGAAKFDPKSDLWTRITLAQGGPLADELTAPDADDWWLPAVDLA